MKLKRRFYGKTDVGRKRQINEDSFYYAERDGLCIVADGMGGHSFGEVASKMAVDQIREYVTQNIHSLCFTKEDSKEKVFGILSKELQQATFEANESIFSCVKTEDMRKRMGTTLVMVYFFKDYVFVAHVGDSRCYVLRQSQIKQLTEDHTIINRWLKIGQITEEEAEKQRNSPNSRYVTRAVGTKQGIKADIGIHKVQHNDLFLLCSDGLTDLLSDEEICDVMVDGELELVKISKQLISMANARGGKDNITVILAHIKDEEQDQSEETAVFYRNKGDAPTEIFIRKDDQFIPKKM